jgi:hypothetical protein
MTREIFLLSIIRCSVSPEASLYGRLSLAARGHGGGREATVSLPYRAFTTDHLWPAPFYLQ